MNTKCCRPDTGTGTAPAAMDVPDKELQELQENNASLRERIRQLELCLHNEQRTNAAANREIDRIIRDFATLEKTCQELRGQLRGYQQHFIGRFIHPERRRQLLPGKWIAHVLRFQAGEAGARRRFWCYRHLPELFRDDPDYQEYRQIRDRCRLNAPEADTGLRLPADLPLTSIIITADGDRRKLYRCLLSLIRSGLKAPFEILVVDGSCDSHLRSLTRKFPGVRRICSDVPVASIAAANLGASEARGEFLVFLAPGAIVLPGWLDELAYALHTRADAGLIGSQSLDLNTGKIMEGGILICRNGWLVPLGAGQEMLHPEFSCFQPVSTVSDTAVIVRRRDFQDQNGLDPACTSSRTAMFDLGLRLRQDGRTNYTMPLARVMLEPAPAADTGDDLNRNKKQFLERWQDFIAANETYSDPDEYRTNRHYPKPRVLFLDAETPMPDRGSGCMDTVYFLDYLLRRGFEVVFHAEYTPGYVPKYTAMLLRKGVRCICQPTVMFHEYLAQRGASFQYLFVSRVYQAQCYDRLLQSYCRNATYIFNTVDLHFIRENREAEISGSAVTMQQAYRTRQLELTFAAGADATIVISSAEKELLEREFGLERIWHIPQVRLPMRRQCSPAGRQHAVFIGSAHRPNQDALRYFHDEILPYVLEKHPDFHLTIIGEALRDAIRNNPYLAPLLECTKFTFVGHVEELGDYLDTARLTITPLRYGAGTKGKVTSSMSYGVPCVSTLSGVEGTGMCHGRDLLIAATPEEFAAAIDQLLTDDALWQKLSDGGLACLKRNNDDAAISARMDQLLAAACQHKCQVEAAFQAVCDAPQLISFGKRLPVPSELAAEQNAMLHAIRQLHPHRQASLYFMSPEPAVFVALKEHWEHVMTNAAPCPPPGTRQGLGAAFDVIAFHSSPTRAALNAALESAMRQLYHGGMIVFPCPRSGEMLDPLFDDLRAAGYQLIYCVPDPTGNGCICARKAIPCNQESTERW